MCDQAAIFVDAGWLQVSLSTLTVQVSADTMREAYSLQRTYRCTKIAHSTVTPVRITSPAVTTPPRATLLEWRHVLLLKIDDRLAAA